MNRKISINLGLVARGLALSIVFVAGLSVCVSIVNYFMNQQHLSPEAAKFWHWVFESFYLDAEDNFPTWYASFTILIAAGLLAFTAWLARQQKFPNLWHWTALAGLFALLSLDEFIQFHETLSVFLHDTFHTTGLLYFTWVAPAVVFVLIVGALYIPFFRGLPPRIRNLMVLAAIIYVGGAVGVEIIEGWYVSLYTEGHLAYELLVYLEETMEMVGIALFIYTLLLNLQPYLAAQPVEITIQ